jgi:cyclic lactone autoinducer peptide
MKKIITKGKDKMNKISKKIAEDSPNIASTFFYYEPKMPKIINKNEKNEN